MHYMHSSMAPQAFLSEQCNGIVSAFYVSMGSYYGRLYLLENTFRSTV